MNQKQIDVAERSMIEWLAHPQELGKKPSKIKCVGEFDLYDLHYYIFKYKKSMLGKWLIGVCGGFEGDKVEHCGHVFSQMKEYNEATGEEDATAMVEIIRSYWMEREEEIEKQKENIGTFVNFVLLKEAVWDKEAFLKQLKDDWQIEDEGSEDGESENKKDYEDIVIVSHNDARIAVALVAAPVPEASFYAKSNYTWKEAEKTVKKHKAHLIVAVTGNAVSTMESGEMLVKTNVSICKQEGVVGIFANETVYQPELYMDFAKIFEEDDFPIFNLVWFGLYKGNKGMCTYTCGMRNFGYDEMEIIDSSVDSQELFEFISDIANYVIFDDVILRDGETIGFSEDQKLPISKSAGVAVEGESLKIVYP